MRFVISNLAGLLVGVVVVMLQPASFVHADDDAGASVEQQRLETMHEHVARIQFRSRTPGFPERLSDQPLFRYDDLTRGYVDGTVWRLGATGRPKAIVTAELHPRYSGEPRVICDYLSLSDVPFAADVYQGTKWTPGESAVRMNEFPDCPPLAATKSQRSFQFKKMAERFTAQQIVEGQSLELRLLPRAIDRYSPSNDDASDGAIFLFVSGRNPGIVLVVEANSSGWEYGLGRLSGPSTLKVSLEGETVWQVSPSDYNWTSSYTASNYPIVIP